VSCLLFSVWEGQALMLCEDNITYYKCDVSNLEEVEAVAAEIREEVCV
jgi:NAD(P)-dependent dehydrogenase (short-subunit alcohol dehydrogenase family)